MTTIAAVSVVASFESAPSESTVTIAAIHLTCLTVQIFLKVLSYITKIFTENCLIRISNLDIYMFINHVSMQSRQQAEHIYDNYIRTEMS